MEHNIQLIIDINQLTNTILNTIENKTNCRILVSGDFNNLLYKDLLDKLLKCNKMSNFKMLIPYVTGNGILSRSYINKITNLGGQIRINSSFKNNIVIIEDDVFVLSYSSRYNKDYGVKSNFECCIRTDDGETLNNIYEVFMKMWIKGFPLINTL